MELKEEKMSLFPEIKSPRPTKIPESMEPKAIKKIAAILSEWNSEFSEKDLEELSKALFKKSLDFYSNGYELAKFLDDEFYITPNSSLVEALDDIGYILNRVLDEAVEDWVRQDHIEPKFKVGDTVTIEIKFGKDKGTYNDGKIYDIDHTKAKYSINVPSLGHKDPNDKTTYGTLGIVLPFEEVESINH